MADSSLTPNSDQLRPRAKVLVTGGAGYVGSVLVPRLLTAGYIVTVLDKMIFGNHLPIRREHLQVIQGDIRDHNLIQHVVKGQDAIIHLAFISNDPQYELNPKIGEAINWSAFVSLVDASLNANVKRFIFASSCSLYGSVLHSGDSQIDESTPPNPLTDYARHKVACENYLIGKCEQNFCGIVVRPATICGLSPRQRLDLMVNHMITTAYHVGEIVIQNSERIRPSLHIKDMVDLYLKLLQQPSDKVRAQVFNAAFENRTMLDLAQLVQEIIGKNVRIKELPSADIRSYHVSSAKLVQQVGFRPRHGVVDAIHELHNEFVASHLPNAITSPIYYNIRVQKQYNWSSDPYAY